MSPSTRRRISSRIGRTASMPCPAGSSSGQSRYRLPGKIGQASPQPMVITTSQAWTASTVRIFGVCRGDVDADLAHRLDGDRVHLVGGRGPGGADLDGVAGEVPASQPAAIWERPALWTQTNRTEGLAVAIGLRVIVWVVDGSGTGVVGRRRRRRLRRRRVRARGRAGAESAADQLRADERRDGCRGDAGEGVGEDPADGDGGVRERRRAGEPVRGTDVRADRGAASAPRPVRARAKISAPGRRWRRPRRGTCRPLARSCSRPAPIARPYMALASTAPSDRTDAPGRRRRRRRRRRSIPVPARRPSSQSTSGDHGVEVRAGDRPEDQDQHARPNTVAVLFSSSCSPVSSGDSRCAAIPDPTTTVTSSAGAERLGEQPARHGGLTSVIVNHT